MNCESTSGLINGTFSSDTSWFIALHCFAFHASFRSQARIGLESFSRYYFFWDSDNELPFWAICLFSQSYCLLYVSFSGPKCVHTRLLKLGFCGEDEKFILNLHDKGRLPVGILKLSDMYTSSKRYFIQYPYSKILILSAENETSNIHFLVSMQPKNVLYCFAPSKKQFTWFQRNHVNFVLHSAKQYKIIFGCIEIMSHFLQLK